MAWVWVSLWSELWFERYNAYEFQYVSVVKALWYFVLVALGGRRPELCMSTFLSLTLLILQ